MVDRIDHHHHPPHLLAARENILEGNGHRRGSETPRLRQSGAVQRDSNLSPPAAPKFARFEFKEAEKTN
ncbi:hypothetical protein GN956_G20731 [Arapaima gigas]